MYIGFRHWLACGAMALSLFGCDWGTSTERMRQLDQQMRELGDQVDKLNKDVAAKDATIEAQRRQITTLQNLGERRLEKLYYVTAIKIDRLTGPANFDDKPGNDGIVVYFSPIDQEGHTIKAAGDIRIQLLDLANPDGQHLIGEYRLDVDHARKAWHGRMLTNHYSVKCPWKSGPPVHDEITVRVEFVDYLTGNTFRDQVVTKLTSK